MDVFFSKSLFLHLDISVFLSTKDKEIICVVCSLQVEEDLKRMKIIVLRAKVEDRQEWNRIVEQTETHLGL